MTWCLEEATKRKTEENTIEALQLCKQADKLMNSREYHTSEQYYLQALQILPQHVQSLCNYAHLLCTGKKVLDKVEELFKKALQSDPHRAPMLFNYAAYLLQRQQVRESRDMYAHACELNPTNPWIQENGHLFQDASQQTRHVQTTPETQSRRNLRVPPSKTHTTRDVD